MGTGLKVGVPSGKGDAGFDTAIQGNGFDSGNSCGKLLDRVKGESMGRDRE
jgi:hypothetical protein